MSVHLPCGAQIKPLTDNDLQLHATLCKAGPLGTCDLAGLEAMAGVGLSWLQIVSLVWQYGPLVTNIANDIISALKSTGGLTLPLINQFISRYGAPVEQMIKDLLAAIGVALPT